MGQYMVDVQKFLEGEKYPTMPADWLLGDNLASMYDTGTFGAMSLANCHEQERVTIDKLGPIAEGYRADMASLTRKYNGTLPKMTQIIAAFLSPHTVDMMIERLNSIEGGAEVAAEAWGKIEEECTLVLLAMMEGDKLAVAEGESTPAETEATVSCDGGTFDPFAAYSPPKKRAAPEEGEEQPSRSALQQARLLAQQEMKLWRTATTANRAKKPILPKKKEDYFNGIQWWSNPRHTNLYRGLMRVAIVNLIVHASATRPERTFSWAGIVAVAKRARLSPSSLKWLVYLKRNSKYMPSATEMADEYLRVYRKSK